MATEEDVQRVGDVMARDVITVGPDERVADVVNRFVDNWIDGAPVVTGDGKLVGMITDGDLVRALAATGIGYAAAFVEPGQDQPADEPEPGETVTDRLYKLAMSRVADLMTRDVITISEDAPLADAAQLMSEYGVKKLPVVRQDRLVGLVSRSDIVLRVLARMSQELVTLRDLHDLTRSEQ